MGHTFNMEVVTGYQRVRSLWMDGGRKRNDTLKNAYQYTEHFLKEYIVISQSAPKNRIEQNIRQKSSNIYMQSDKLTDMGSVQFISGVAKRSTSSQSSTNENWLSYSVLMNHS